MASKRGTVMRERLDFPYKKGNQKAHGIESSHGDKNSQERYPAAKSQAFASLLEHLADHALHNEPKDVNHKRLFSAAKHTTWKAGCANKASFSLFSPK